MKACEQIWDSWKFGSLAWQVLPLGVCSKRENLKSDWADIVLIHTSYVVWGNVVLIYEGFYSLTTLVRGFWCNTLTGFYVQYKLLVCMHLCVRCFAFSSASCDSASQNLLIEELSHLAESVFLCKCDWLVSFCISLDCSPDFSLLLLIHCPTLMLPSPSYGAGWDLLTHFCCSPGW